ncbi:non-ribosomal peptide synthetase [Actinokineospora cianjurensis]|uniref:Amino acid adenylation domain-containing protein n=1 Tax=Actinokineospora cianjurensis TaxID=585224 RepID=A0A421B0T8_9PSEU|nr:non-ribosomal peptide synthetase [Actinokineospora cianjurensis]RLK57994.1 amino acid adenylation domain-containing protein [Actinokineospora cianjurensis]
MSDQPVLSTPDAAERARLRLPTDRPRVSAGPRSRAEHRAGLPKDLVYRLRMFGVRRGTSLFVLVAAASEIVFARYTGERDFVVGASVGGGAPVPLVSTVDGAESFHTFLGGVRRAVLDARGPLESDPTVLLVEGEPPQTPVDLVVSVVEHGETVELVIGYDAALFDATTAERLVGHLTTLLAGALADPGRAVFHLPLVTGAERHRLLLDWNDTTATYPAHRTLPDIVAEHARRTPDEPAVVADTGTLTYAELNALANRLAHRLIAAGTRPEYRVGVLQGRAPHVVVSVLAVLKAGGTLVPMHHGQPDDRLRWVLDETGAVAVLTDRAMSARAVATGVPAIVVDEPDPTEWPDTDPDLVVHPDQVAYVMYTSGSTGTPKGAAVTHRDVVALGWDERMRADAHRVVLFHNSHAFDALTYEVLVPLITGGRTVVAPDQLTPRLLARLIADHGVTSSWITAALFAQFTDEDPRCFTGMREIWTGGEAPSPAALERALTACPDVVLVNGYGPTECTTYSTSHRLSLAEVKAGSTPIGRPLDNTRAYVLDEYLAPVPTGAPGELYLAGEGLARGYFGKPGFTAERFVADPFGSGGRLYRTGDVVRWNSAGELEFVGRTDDQVKLRGFRIELGEIDTALCLHPAVGEAVTVVHEAGEARTLVAYVVSTGVDEDTLRDFLTERLPSYMVPSRFVALDSMPITVNGKVDRRALPDPNAVATATLVAPRTDAERALAEVWCELLGLDRVSVTDSFFALGGDSILTMKVVNRARARGIALTVEDVFDTPTIAELAAVESAPPATVDIEPTLRPDLDHLAERLGGGVEDVYPLTAMQSGMLFDTLMAPDARLHVVQIVLEVGSVDDPAVLDRAWQHAATQHPVLRTAVVWEGVDAPVQVVRRQVRTPVTHVDLRAEADPAEQVNRLREREKATGFDLAAPPLHRITLARTTDADITIIWTLHHILLDGWSSAELIRDVFDAYTALRAGTGPQPVVRRPFRDFVAWADLPVAAAAEAHWRQRISGLGTPTALPEVAPRDDTHRPCATARVDRDVPAAVVADLGRFARGHGLTVNTLVQGAWAVLLSRHTARGDICFGTTATVRPTDLADVDSVVGPLINTLPTRVEVDERRDLLPWLRDLQAEQVAARRYASVPLPRIQGWSGVPSGANLFDTIVVFQNYPFDRGAVAAGLRLRSFDVEFTSNFPIALCVLPGDEMSIQILHDPALFDTATVERISAHLITLLESLARQGDDAVLGDLRMLTDAEQRTIIDQWGAATDTGQRVHEVIAERAQSTPDDIALGSGLTYAELDGHANRLARFLLRQGIGLGTVVGIGLEPGADLVTAVLATVKTGAAYLPLDPTYPVRLLATAIAGARPAVVLTTDDHAGILAAAGAKTAIMNQPAVFDHPDTAPDPIGGPDDLAAISYTADPEGTPRAVLLTHRALAAPELLASGGAAVLGGRGVVRVLDARLRPVPAGVVGELHVDARAWGYLGRPGRTAQRFVADPFGDGTRLHRTGELARWSAEGALEVVGRTDEQVVVQGTRVEPAEVALVLRGHSGVRDAAVVVRADDTGSARLTAYVVAVPGGPAPTGRDLKTHVADHLPAAAVPASIRLVPKLPGHQGRQGPTAPESTYLAPRNPTEEALCLLWSDVLHVDRVGADDDFFRLGGDSITSIRLVSRIRSSFTVDLSPHDLFDRPRLAELAAVIQERVLDRLLSAPGA